MLCKHEDSGHRCLVAHVGQQSQCRQCLKCGTWY